MSMQNKRQVIPGIFTTLNLLCGFISVTKTSEGAIEQAAWLIVFATIFDMLDGQFARLTKSSSDFGIEFDSLADVVSFGVAPSFLLYSIVFKDMGFIGVLLSFSPLVAGTFRLARFNINVSGFEKSNFSGIPITMAALCIASFIIFNYNFWHTIQLERLVIPLILLLCLIMVSNVEYYTLPKLTFRLGAKHSSLIIVMLILLTIVIFFPHEALFPSLMIYVLWGIIRHTLNIIRTLNKQVKSQIQIPRKEKK
ncbi:CDP-diacylglycerol--serine O-phosphatidyltransferase [candidate division KSB1 bacterium]|nr:CDP-diacylglycerol--serine O-phosphatidyltransferase [candidate division KSB1 bacterium]